MPPPEDAPQDDESLDPEVARALNAACDALCNADNDYARLLAITNGVEALKNLGDDGSRAIERLRESAIKDFGMKAADVQIAIDQGVERTMVARATRRISGGRNQHNPHCDGAGSEGKRAADDLVSGTNVKKSGTRNRAGGKNTGVDEIWPDPDWSILEDRRGELPQFPSEKMPAGVQRWLTDAAHGAGVTPAHVAVPLLAVTAGVVGAARRIRASNSWSEPLTLWAAVIGLSGTGKTPGIDVSKRGLSSVERDRRGKIAELRRLHETASEAAMAAHKRWKDDVKNATESGKSPPPMPVEATKPEEFVAPRLWVSDATIERLAVLLRARPSGLLMICDELAGLFLNMGRYNAGHDHEFWLEAWNGKPFVVERMGRSPVEVEHLLIGIVGGFQPDKLVRSFERDDDGMYARMLFAWPEEPGYQKLTNNVDENDPAIHNAIARLVRLTDTPSGQVDAGFRSYRSFCSPKTVWLSPQAAEEFERFRQFIHEKKSELDGREREWLSKSGTHVLRLAGTLAFLGWSWTGGEEEPTEISVQVIQNAIDLLLSYFWPHARAALRQVGLSESRTNQRRILRWIRANHKTAISLQDIRRDALGGALDAPKTEELLSALVRSGWLRKSELPAGPKGGKPLKRWLINPVLFSSADTAQTAETLSRRSTSVSNPAPAVADRFLGGPDRLIWTPDDVPPF